MAAAGAASGGGLPGDAGVDGCGASGQIAHAVGAAVRRELEPLIGELVGAAVRRELEPLVSKLGAIEEMLRPIVAGGATPQAPRGTVLSQTPAEVRRQSCHDNDSMSSSDVLCCTAHVNRRATSVIVLDYAALTLLYRYHLPVQLNVQRLPTVAYLLCSE